MKIIFFKRKEKNFEKENLALNINFYWKLAVSFMFIAILAFSFFGYYLLKKINKEFVAPTRESGGQIKTVKKERIDKALEYFSLREQKSNQILNLPSPVSDPSL